MLVDLSWRKVDTRVDCVVVDSVADLGRMADLVHDSYVATAFQHITLVYTYILHLYTMRQRVMSHMHECTLEVCNDVDMLTAQTQMNRLFVANRDVS